MSKRLDPSGLAGAFSREKQSAALDFLVPVRAEPKPEPQAEPHAPLPTPIPKERKRPATAKRPLPPPLPRRSKREHGPTPTWAPSAPPFPKPQWMQRVVGRRLEAWIGLVLRKVLTR